MAYDWIVDALEATWSSTERLLRERPEEAFERMTSCPGWSVKDVLSHLLGFELLLNGAPVPTMTGSWPAYVKNPIGEMNEAFVEERRARRGHEVLTEFRHVTAASLAALRALDEDAWTHVGWSPEGERPFYRFQETRVLDSWIHLQDIRDALLEPEDDHGPGEEIVLNRFEAALPYVLGKRVAPPSGTTVRINLSGRLARSVWLRVEDGRATTVDASDLVPDLELTTPVALFWRRCAGRISAPAFLAASATDVRGSRALATALADGLNIMI